MSLLEALIDPGDENMVYGCSQYGECSRSTNGGTTSSDFTGATVSSRRNWLSPLQFDPSNSAVLYYAGNQVNRSADHAVHWSVISPDLTGGPGRDLNYPFGTITTVAAAKTDLQSPVCRNRRRPTVVHDQSGSELDPSGPILVYLEPG